MDRIESTVIEVEEEEEAKESEREKCRQTKRSGGPNLNTTFWFFA